MSLYQFDERKLRRLPKPPRLHPLGFIQLELEGMERRLHVWPARPMPMQGNRTEWHDHLFGIDSEVICGTVTNLVAEFTPHPDGAWRMLYVNPYSVTGKESQFSHGPPGELFSMEVVERRTVHVGQSYQHPPYAFHVTRPHGFAATIMKMTSLDTNGRARVVQQRDEPIPPLWNREIVPVEELWNEIRRVCK